MQVVPYLRRYLNAYRTVVHVEIRGLRGREGGGGTETLTYQ